MKIKRYLIGLLGLAVLGFTGCDEPYVLDRDFSKGLLDVKLYLPGGDVAYTAEKKGPYKDGETITVKMPTSENPEEAIDLTRILIKASLENDSRVVPSLTMDYVDFTEPYKIVVHKGNGEVVTNYITILPVLPETIFNTVEGFPKKLQDMQVNAVPFYSFTCGIAANSKYAIMPTATASDFAGPINVYSAKTMVNAKNPVASPQNFIGSIGSDAAGNFVVCRYNVYGAGFMVYLYNSEMEIQNGGRPILDCTAAQTPPGIGATTQNMNLFGQRMRVCGDLTKGTAFIYASGAYGWEFSNAMPSTLYQFEFKDGKLVYPDGTPYPTVQVAPVQIPYPSPSQYNKFNYSNTDRISTAPDAKLFVSYQLRTVGSNVNPGSGGTDKGQAYGSRFEIYDPITGDIIQMDPKNHDYQIMDHKVFTIHGKTYVALLSQGLMAWDGYTLKVFDITDPSRLSWTPEYKEDNVVIPETPGYSTDFMVFAPTWVGAGSSWNRTGYVDVVVDEAALEAYIYVGYNGEAAQVAVYKMRYFPR